MLLSIPNSFTSNTTILSAAANGNFSAVASVINGNLQEDNFGTLAGALNWTISGNVLALNIASASTTGVIVASLTGVLASTKAALDIESSTAQSTGRSLAYFNLSNGASSIPAVSIANAGTGAAISIAQSGAGYGLLITQSAAQSGLKVAQSANAKGIEVTNSGTSPGISVTQSGNGYATDISNSGTSSGVRITDSGTGTAALEIVSTTKGVLPPRMTYTQRNAISSPAEGLEIYNTDSHCKQVYGGGSWVNIGPQVGDIVPSSRSSAAPGFLSALDGASYNAGDYPELASILWDGSTSKYKFGGTGTYPTGTFNAPKFGGYFLRGADGSAGNDPDKASRTAMTTGGNTGNNVGSVQGQATKKNGLSLADGGHVHTEVVSNGTTSSGTTGPQNIANQLYSNSSTSTASANSNITLGSGDNETRPLNAYVNYFIKF